MYLKESYTNAEKLQQTFADEVIKSHRLINAIRKGAEEERSKGVWQYPEKDWLIGRHKIFTDVLAKLEDVRDHEPCFVNKHHAYVKLIDKIKTDFLTLLNERIKSIKPSCSILDAQSSDDSGTDGQSKNRDKYSSKCQEQVNENESNSGVDTDDKSDCNKRQKCDFKLLYECTLTLKNERNNFFKIYLLVEERQICKIL
ncbi:unnamed protein product [Mytilus coruscus]|uniref:Uncharacterized protein n=1 Tax=Mytilus coruscus TaxID=42192 RepID=A0A6J8DGA3_MYTCO|nr:unnamed protein product [Mytilus coruscus]